MTSSRLVFASLLLLSTPALADVAPGGGCRCDAIGAPMGWLPLALIALVALRRG